MTDVAGAVNVEQNTDTLMRFFQALETGDLELLEEVCHPDLRMVEPELVDVPYESLEALRQRISGSARGTFEIFDIEPVGDSLIAHERWTPPGPGGEPSSWMMVVSFWDGKIARLDGKRTD